MTSPKTYDMLVRPITVAVRSESDPAKTYEVHLPYCPCADFEYQRGNGSGDYCKHLRQAMAAVAGWHGQPAACNWVTYGAARRLLVKAGIDEDAARDVLDRALDDGKASTSRPDGGTAEVAYGDGLFEVTITA